jgi:type VI secretion system secreted protein Hcp
MTVKGAKQGVINGSVAQKGREKTIEVIACDQIINSPIDAHTGLSTGKRVHKPLYITKQIDASTPGLYIAHTQNETLTSVVIKFYRPTTSAVQTGGTGGATEDQYFTIELTNAIVCETQLLMYNNRNPEVSKYPELQRIGFTFMEITWTLTAGGITANDSWLQPG